MSASRDLAEIYHAAIEAVDPFRAVLDAVKVEGNLLSVSGENFDLSEYNRIIVIGAGKATGRMAQAIESRLGSRISEGLVIVKEGHGVRLDMIEQIEASHPIPDEKGEEGARRILEMAEKADERTLLLCLFSGGASSLLVLPEDDLTLQDKKAATALLLNSGASISELNAVRKHLSKVKGGRLAMAAYPARILTLVVSDVIGDRQDVIASGPTASDGSAYNDALDAIEKYGLEEKMPERVIAHLEKGKAGLFQETLKQSRGEALFVVANIDQALAAAKNQAERLGYRTEIVSSTLQGEARKAAEFLSGIALAKDILPLCLLSGGETTVTVRGEGKGGRNQELALAFAIAVEGREGISMLSAGTDGSDGPTDAAGAIVDGHTCLSARLFGLTPESYLEANDSYGFFDALDASSGMQSHFRTGPTGTNVMDIQIILLKSRAFCASTAACPEGP